MAPAIVHFLVGASLLLLLSAPFAVRHETVRRHGLILATAGGLWGLLPDVHHVIPGEEGPFRTFHRSAWADPFAFHYTLDMPPVRTAGLGATEFPAVLVFLGAAVAFALASEWGARQEFEPVAWRREMLGGVAGGALASTALLGGAFHLTGRIGAVGAVVGSETTVVGWAVIGGGGVLAAGVFAVWVELVTRDAVALPIGTAFGALVAVPAWLFVTVLVVPLWRMRAFDAPLEASPGDPAGLVAFVLAGGTLGAAYVTVVRVLAGRGPGCDERLGRPTERS